MTLCASSGFEMSPINVHERYLNYDVEVEDGDLVIFPANMMHFVSEFEGDEHRMLLCMICLSHHVRKLMKSMRMLSHYPLIGQGYDR